MEGTDTLKWFDYVVIGLMLSVSICIGLYYRFTGGRQKTTQEYFSANKSMSILPVGVALMVSFMSAITLLGVSQENYTHGTQFVVINISYLIGTPIVCYCFLPVFYNLGAVSAYEYLEKRFGYETRLMASFMYWIQLLLYSGVVLYAPALALQATTHFPLNWSIIAIGLACAFYSSVGGIKAVLITDVFQGLLMFVSVFIIIVSAVKNAGGVSEVWRIAQEGGRIELDNMSFDPTVRHSVWNLTIGGLATFLSLYGVNQVQVQRLLTVKNLKSARLALWLNWPILTALSLTTCFSGLAMFSYYSKLGCDPVTSKSILSPDMLMPRYIMDNLSSVPGLPGLFIAGIFSAGLSTISAALNSLAAVTLEDYVKPLYRRFCSENFSEQSTLLTGKLLAFLFGILCIVLAFVAQQLEGVLQISLTIFGVVGGPLLGVFTLGMLCKCANQHGAITGALGSLIFLLWIGFGKPRPELTNLPGPIENCPARNFTSTILPTSVNESKYFYLYRISYMWYAPLGFLITMVIGLLVSMVTRGNNKDLNPDLFFPFIASRLRKQQHGNRRQSEDNGKTKANPTYYFKRNSGPKDEDNSAM